MVTKRSRPGGNRSKPGVERRIDAERARHAVYMGATASPKHEVKKLEKIYGAGNVETDKAYKANGSEMTGFKGIYVKIPAYNKVNGYPEDWRPWEANSFKAQIGELVE